MQLPQLNVIKKTTHVVDQFLGYNNSARISDQEFRDDLNMSCCEYPLLRPRELRNRREVFEASFVRDGNEKEAYDYDQIVLCSCDKIAYLVGPNLFYDDILVSRNFGTGENDSLTYMNGKLITFPAGRVYDIASDVASDIGITQEFANEGAYTFKTELDFKKNIKLSAKKSGVTLEYTYGLQRSEFTTDPTELFNAAKTGTKNIDVYVNAFKSSYVKLKSVEYKYYMDSDQVALKFTFVSKKKFSTRSVAISGTLGFKGNTCLDIDTYIEAFLCDGSDYTKIDKVVVNDKAPENPDDGMYWIDTSDESATLKKWSEQSSMWAQVLTAYYKFIIHNSKLIDGFKAGDTVVLTTGSEDIDGPWNIQAIGDDRTYFVINAVLRKDAYIFPDSFVIARNCPDLNYVCEMDNRIWGLDVANNEIRACALGDPYNWEQDLEALSTDSYALKVASEGPFTGIAAFGGAILCFKENYIHKIFGTKPTNYAIRTTKTYGVEEGAHDSIASVNGALYFKGKYGIYAYSGSMPELVSKFGNDKYTGGNAATYKDYYYIHFRKEGVVFCYDTKYGIWHKESSSGIGSNMIEHCSDLYYMSKSEVVTKVNGYMRLGTGVMQDAVYDTGNYYVRIAVALNANVSYRIRTMYRVSSVRLYNAADRDITAKNVARSQSGSEHYTTFTAAEDCAEMRLYFSRADTLKAITPAGTMVASDFYASELVEGQFSSGSPKKFWPMVVEDMPGVEDFAFEPLPDFKVITEGDTDADETLVLYDIDNDKYYRFSNGAFIQVSEGNVKYSDYDKNTDIAVQHYELLENVETVAYMNRTEEFEEDNEKEALFEWKAETGEIGLSLSEKKWISRIVIRASIPEGAQLKVWTEYDSSGEWKLNYDRTGAKTLNTIAMPIVPRRCDHMRIRFSGKGLVRIYSISKEVEKGSEM